MGLRDADLKIEKLKKEHSNIYQSSQHPMHFDNEGEEYMNAAADSNDKIENAGFDKAHGIEKPSGQRPPVSNAETAMEQKNSEKNAAAGEIEFPGTTE